MRLQRAAILAAAAVAVVFTVSFAADSAEADIVQFTIVDGVNTVTFDLAESPTPSLATSTLFQIDNEQVDITSNGYKSALDENVDFYAANGGAEFISDQNSFYAFDVSTIKTGPYFTGSTSDPTFVPGDYSGGSHESVTVSDISTTPLPAALPLFAGGLGVVGFLYHRSTERRANESPSLFGRG